MEFDLTVTISAILAICAIFSPFLTTIVSKFFELKEKRMELRYKHYSVTNMKIIKYLEGFSQSLTNIFEISEADDPDELFTSYKEDLGKAAPYMSKQLFDLVINLDVKNLPRSDLYTVLRLIRSEIEQYQKLPKLK